MSTRAVLSFALWCTFLLGVGAPASAQCATIPGTGCPNQLPVACHTQPRVGTGFTFACGPTCSFGVDLFAILVGTRLATPIPLPSPPVVLPSCTLGCLPLLVLRQQPATLVIPSNQSLVGVQLCIQCTCTWSTGALTVGPATIATLY
jgi:hypothetical protein